METVKMTLSKNILEDQFNALVQLVGEEEAKRTWFEWTDTALNMEDPDGFLFEISVLTIEQLKNDLALDREL